MKTSSLKVDNLRHIHDHGLAVEFTEPKLVTLLTYLRGKQGVTELKAGLSTLKVTTLGNVTKTEAFFSVGSNRLKAIHYYETATGLKYTVKRENGEGCADAFLTLNAVIFGGELPGIWTVNFGAQADKLRDWLNKYRWTITGSNGLRGQALAGRFATLEYNLTQANRYARDTAEKHERYVSEATPEFFRERHSKLRTNLAAKLAQIDEKVARLETQQKDSHGKTAEELYAQHFSLGVCRDWIGGNDVHYFPAVGSQFSHPVQMANYSATVDSCGTISLSSGIKCEFTATQVLAWLKGEAQAPSSRYGAIERREVATRDGLPLVLLKCGCHFVDPSGVSAEFAELLKPKHVVTKAEGKPRADFGTPEFSLRLAEAFAQKLQNCADERADKLREFADARANLETQERDLPAYLADLLQKRETAKAASDAAETALTQARANSPLGADADTLANLSRVFLTSQSFHPVISK